jgi:integrase
LPDGAQLDVTIDFSGPFGTITLSKGGGSATVMPINPYNVHRHFGKHVKKAGVPRIPFHGLRHTHATILMLSGVHPKVVSERLGHADIGITLSIYSHVLPQMQQEAANTFAAAVVPKRN